MLLLVLSALLSRGTERAMRDGGEGTAMVDLHGYCTQELVNLLLTGAAVPYVFDGERNVDGAVLRGVSRRADLGLLTLLEAFGHVEVGQHLKTPRHPVWVVCSESHYTILFRVDENIEVQEADECAVQLVFFDTLEPPSERVVLTVTTDAGPCARTRAVADCAPPLELVIGTKWPGATIDWNGTEPIL
jgi:hypothetical protein